MDSLNIKSRVIAVFDYVRTHRLLFMAVLAAVVIAALWAAIDVLRPMPPRTLVMATGPEGSAYHEFGKRYRDILARAGVELRLKTTAGALENLALLKDPRSNVDVGFLQSGTTSGKVSPGLESLGTVFYEPMWFFYQGIYRGKGAQVLRGRKISIGPEGSGTRELALKVLAMNGVDQSFADLLPLALEESGDKLVRGEIAAALMLTSWDDPVVQRLLVAKGIELVSYPRADAYVALYPYLNKVVLPEGVADLAKNRPSSNVNLFAPKANLVVRKDLHPALQYLLLDAAEQVHFAPGIFHKAGQFPAAESSDLPLSDEARQFYKSGKPFFQRHLPFWLAVLMGRLLVLIIPVVGVIYPLVQVLMTSYDLSMRQRIYRLYGELRFMEKDMESRVAGQSADDLSDRLDQIEEKASRLKVPATYGSMLYTLRDHIVQVRGLLKKP
jgi:TRAP-type uncharacterized transport system substrate-binding protein